MFTMIEAASITGLSVVRLRQVINGYTRLRNNNKYRYKSQLIEGEHYIYSKHGILINDVGIELIKELKGKRVNNYFDMEKIEKEV